MSSGFINQSGGQLTATGYGEYVGYNGSGEYTQSGGVNTSTNGGLGIAWYAGNSGTYNLSGGQLTLGFDEVVGYGGTGQFMQTGGTVSLSGPLTVGWLAGSSGTYSLSNGLFNSTSPAGKAVAYDGGTGLFMQTGGTHSVTGQLTIGGLSGSSGTYSLSDGMLQAAAPGEQVGYDGAMGQFMQSGGTNAVSGPLTLGTLPAAAERIA